MAAALATGLTGDKASADNLWPRLEKESDIQVQKELYLALGNLAPDNLFPKMIQQLQREEMPVVRAALFQSLAIALTFKSRPIG